MSNPKPLEAVPVQVGRRYIAELPDGTEVRATTVVVWLPNAVAYTQVRREDTNEVLLLQDVSLRGPV